MKKRIDIFLGYNLPFLLWMGGVLLNMLLNSWGSWKCPIVKILHVCAGCSLTRDLGYALQGHGPFNAWLISILGGFFLVFLSSMYKIITLKAS